MDVLLMDIKKFLKKLENGQIEIEVGQWELHKDIENMNDAVNELIALKDEVENITIKTAEQMALIKELQMRLDALDKLGVNSESCILIEEISKKAPREKEVHAGSTEVIKNALESYEISEVSSVESKLKCEESRNTKGTQCAKEKVNKSSRALSQKKQPPRDDFPKNEQKPKCSKRSVKHEILERYLKDSAKYLKKKISKSAKNSHKTSRGTTQKKIEESLSRYASLGDAPHSKTREKTDQSAGERRKVSEKKFVTKPLQCHKCSKQFKCRSGFLKHERKHRKSLVAGYCKTCGKGFGSKERLKEHEAIHENLTSPKTFKGFKCSYCDKTCTSPEKLTEHLRQCRIIKKTCKG